MTDAHSLFHNNDLRRFLHPFPTLFNGGTPIPNVSWTRFGHSIAERSIYALLDGSAFPEMNCASLSKLIVRLLHAGSYSG